MNSRNWGGNRTGAGRKKGIIVYKKTTITLPEQELQFLKKHADAKKISVSRFIRIYLGLDKYAEFNDTAEEGRK